MDTATPLVKAGKSTLWHLTDAFLIEEADGLVRFWGRWDAAFGLWDEHGAPVEPDRPPLGRLGTWAEPEGVRDESWFASRAALAAYWSMVPTSVRLRVSVLGERQWNALLTSWLEGVGLASATVGTAHDHPDAYKDE